MNIYRLPDQQNGAALVVGLILLVAVTVLAISGIKSTSIQQSMATNMQERVTVFQGAESLIRQVVNTVNSTDALTDADGDGVIDENMLVTAINNFFAVPQVPAIEIALNSPSALINGTANFSYVGESNVAGFSMGVGSPGAFIGHNFLVNSTARMPAANAAANNMQGLIRVAPAAQ